MPKVIHFEINADQPERAIKFYESVFGWKVQKWEGPMDYWLVATGEECEPGINGAIAPRSNPALTTVNTIDVPNFDEFAAKILAAGGKQLMPKTAVPGIGHMAYFQDTEGNTFGIMESDPGLR